MPDSWAIINICQNESIMYNVPFFKIKDISKSTWAYNHLLIQII